MVTSDLLSRLFGNTGGVKGEWIMGLEWSKPHSDRDVFPPVFSHYLETICRAETDCGLVSDVWNNNQRKHGKERKSEGMKVKIYIKKDQIGKRCVTSEASERERKHLLLPHTARLY